ncbi:MAG: RHS repeat-associated core domain-containing protein [Opitutaceae bacterium]|nr:RHS repeat-associated core domain-containing protein [Opitutaceae bacterium]
MACALLMLLSAAAVAQTVSTKGGSGTIYTVGITPIGTNGANTVFMVGQASPLGWVGAVIDGIPSSLPLEDTFQLGPGSHVLSLHVHNGAGDHGYSSDQVTFSVGGLLPEMADPARLNWHTVGGAVQLAAGAEATRRPLFQFHGARDWDFALNYDSGFGQWASAGVGKGWTHDFQSRLDVFSTAGGLMLSRDAYRRSWFAPSPSDPAVYVSGGDNARYETIMAQGGGWLLTRQDQSSLLFDASGRLVEDRDPHGRKLILTYDSTGLLSSISDPVSGTGLTLGYDSNRLLRSLTDTASAQVQLNYSSTTAPLVDANLVEIINQNGKKTTLTYDSSSRLLTLADHNGQVLTSNSYTNGKVTAQLDGIAGRPASTFDYTPVAGQPTTTYTDHAGKAWVRTFDANYNLVSEKSPLNHITTSAYDSANRLTSVTDSLGRTTAYTYDTRGNVLTVTDPAGKVTTFTYDARNNLLTTTLPVPGAGPTAPVTTRTYDANNNLLTLQDALGRTMTWTYDTNSLPLTMTLPGGGVTTYAYTAGRLTQVTDPQGVVTKFGYDANGRLLYREDALGKRVSFTYDAVGNVLTVKNALNEATTYTYDHRNRVATITNPAGTVTTHSYDHAHNLLTSTVTAASLPTLVTTYTYDGENRLKTVTTSDPDASGTGAGKDPLVTTYNYDDAGRLTSIVAPGGTTQYGYDSAGQLTTVTDPAGKLTASEYNSRGLLIKVTDPLSRATHLAYDDVGRRKTVTDHLGRITAFDYDALHRVTKVTDPGSLVAEQGFDLNGNRTSLKNPANAATAFAYDNGNRLTTATTPEGRATGYTYNSRGLPASVVEPSTQTTTFAYDAAQRLASTTDAVGTITLGRDSAGRVTTVVEGAKTLTRVYDAYDRLASYTDGDGNVIGYTYDDLGRLKKLTYPGTPIKEVTYAYDVAGRLGSVTDWASRVTTYSYDAVGRLTQLLRPNGTKQTRAYDNAGQLTHLTELAPDGTTVIYSGAHSYDLAGQLTGETILPALAAAIVSTTQTFDADNRLLTHNGAATTFDADGNLLTVATGHTPSSYTYDARNRLTAAGGLTYGYNAENRRISITDGGGTTSYVVNPNAAPDQVLIKTAPGGTKTFYVYGLGLLHEETGGTPRYYHFDRRGDTIALTDNVGAVTGRAAYGVYGEILSQSGTINTPFLFNGRWGVQTDSNGLYHHRARYYHPQLRRFLNQDVVLGDVGDSASMNRFAYANGNPVSLMDPFGLMALDVAANILVNADIWKEGISAWKESGRYLPSDRILMRALVFGGLTVGTLDAILNLVSGGSKAAASGTLKAVTHADDVARAVKAAETAATRTTLYRAVSPGEFADAVGNQVLRPGPNSYATGKFFAENAADAAKWGKALEGPGNFRIIQVEFESGAASQFMRWQRLDGIGPARFGTFEQMAPLKISPLGTP